MCNKYYYNINIVEDKVCSHTKFVKRKKLSFLLLEGTHK